ncbi:hypothetical protein DDB_G0276627 [Dictyostelium discoideum AX4]|uniref:Uncharacterized protein n=1 Tax=Dictyostelium discoideum TaxID=44689 RepID=Q551D7_DICDI|nr:hypothetical protein DDB_G0276627 [Dictyostelium discoideum AX4]EAL69126.1 hypothetical protein DDB_G0276627 [Dictyostelium discoideum AX4]|eukprot:XP_643056.1 hypothetical protein DDB_G0276627 [Dictyostelium discoideum AX4]
MTISAKSRIKQCDPFCTRKPLEDKTATLKDKPVKAKKSNSVPKSLKTFMEGVQLVKQIDEKRKQRTIIEKKQQDEKKKLQEEIKNNNTTTTTTTTTTATTTTNTSTTTPKINNNNNKRLNKKQLKQQQKEKQVIVTDLKDDIKKLNSLYYRQSREDVPEGVKEEEEIENTNLKKYKGELHSDYLDRINKEIAKKMKKSTSTYQKRKEFFDEKKLKEKLKKQGVKYSDYLEKEKREEEKRKEQEEGGSESTENGKKKRKRNVDDFDELKDNIRFGEQIERPPSQLPTLKNFTNKKVMQNTDSSKRDYLWQQTNQGSTTNNENLISSKKLEEEKQKKKNEKKLKKQKITNEADAEQEALKRNLEALKQKTIEHYNQTKKRRQLQNKKEIKENKESENPQTLKRKFYL